MSESSSRKKTPLLRRIGYGIGIPLWLFATFLVAQLIVSGVVSGVVAAGWPLAGMNETVLNVIFGAVIYGLTILLCVGLPWLVLHKKTTAKEVGLHRAPTWGDVGVAPLGMIVYWVATLVVMTVAGLLTSIDLNQAQDVGFNNVLSRADVILAFVMLVGIAPFAEEVLFRGYLFGKLRKYVSLPAAILLTSALFGFVHGQWNVGLDTFVLSVVMCLLVVWRGNLWPAIFVHMLKNGVAFYFLFINPVL